MTYAKIILVVLQLIDRIVDYLRDNKLIDEGYDKAIAETSASILRKSAYAKSVMETISGLSADDTDKLLQSMEPKPIRPS